MSDEPTLLVVDDEEAICEGCRRIFSHQGFAVQKCNDANRGLNMATHGDYAAVLLDVKMPEMDGLQFLESLRKSKPSVPVVLMTGYPSIPNAASAVRLGASDYVTKPFTPEEISQAVHRLLHANANPAAAALLADAPPAGEPVRFYRESWYQMNREGVVRVGALVARPGVDKIESLSLPRIGEVMYQGLPLASITVAGQPPRIIPAPVSGVVASVNDSLAADPAALLSDPCGRGWIACICPTRLEEEAKKCSLRKVFLMSRDIATAELQAVSLKAAGCDVHIVSEPQDLAGAEKDTESSVLLFDAKTFDKDGPGIVGTIKTENPSLKTVIMASDDCIMEAAYRIRRIYYYAVEPFADNEILDILSGVFAATAPIMVARHVDIAQPLGGVFITNRNRTRVRLIAAPGLLRREQGLGFLLRHKLMQDRFPLESSPSETPITPMNLLSTAAHCDRVIVLLPQKHGRLPGSLTRDTKAEYIAMVGAGADKVTTFLVEPSDLPEHPLAFEPHVVDALADHLIREMASC
jgi:FixJ family two-component response regulator/glycine cleavage system H lipoate-binding protein